MTSVNGYFAKDRLVMISRIASHVIDLEPPG